MVDVIDKTVFCRVQDNFGAVATIHYSDAGLHKVVYRDKNGLKFFEEEYAKFSIEYVEQMVIDWGRGKRELI